MRIRSFELLSLAAFIRVNSANAASCSAGNGAPVVAITQPGNVENCGAVGQPLILDNTSSLNGLNTFSPECVVSTTNVPLQGVPIQGVPSQPGQGYTNAPPFNGVNECVPVNQQYNPPMATTIINPPTSPAYGPPGSPGSPGNNNNPPAGGNPPAGYTPPPPQKAEEQCTVTTKLDCESVTPGQEEVSPPVAGPPIESVGVPAVHKVSYASIVQQPQRFMSVIPPGSVPCVPVSSGNGHPNGSYSGVPSTAQVPCVQTSQPHVPVTAAPAGTVSGAPGTTTLGTGAGVPIYTQNNSSGSLCNSPQNALNSVCGSGNAVSGASHASNVGAACALPNAEHCLTKAIDNLGKLTPQEATSCVTTTKQPMVEIGMMLPASEKYVQAMNNPCVLN